MFLLNQELEQVCLTARDLKAGRGLNPTMQTFDAWLAQNKQRIPVE
jgi:hypothetical protein